MVTERGRSERKEELMLCVCGILVRVLATYVLPRSQSAHPPMSAAPVNEVVPAGHSKQLVAPSSSCMYLPGPQNSHLDAPSILKPAPAPHEVQESTEPVLYRPAVQFVAPILRSPSFTTSSPASTVGQKPLPEAEYLPTLHSKQPSMELAPVSLYLPVSHSKQLLVEFSSSCLYLPGPQDSHVDDPALLKPVPHDVHESADPMLKEPAGHFCWSVRSGRAACPALTGVHEAAPEKEKVPSSSHGAHVSLPPSEEVDAAQGTHELELESARLPGPQ